MLTEWITFLTTPCPWPLRRLGYLTEIVGTASRHRRCRRAWAPHLENTREAILAAAETAPGRRKATVLGSGLLLDVPLAELASRFAEVVLVDILHLRPARRAAARFANVRLVAADIAGVAAGLAAFTGGDPLALLPGDPPALPEADADLVVSANLLGQLPQVPCARLRRLGVADGAVDAFARALIRRHVEALARVPGRVCLITEIEHQLCLEGEIVETFDPLYGTAIGPVTREWLWDIAPKPEVDRTCDLRYRVVATAGPAALS